MKFVAASTSLLVASNKLQSELLNIGFEPRPDGQAYTNSEPPRG